MNVIKYMWDDLSSWSQETFGSDIERGPIGALKHLQQEAQEAIESPYDLMEYADCQILIWDATRRAGFTFDDLYAAVAAKQAINKTRTFPKPTTDEPVHHVTEG